jgi:hypothetical protein
MELRQATGASRHDLTGGRTINAYLIEQAGRWRHLPAKKAAEAKENLHACPTCNIDPLRHSDYEQHRRQGRADGDSSAARRPDNRSRSTASAGFHSAFCSEPSRAKTAFEIRCKAEEAGQGAG